MEQGKSIDIDTKHSEVVDGKEKKVEQNQKREEKLKEKDEEPPKDEREDKPQKLKSQKQQNASKKDDKKHYKSQEENGEQEQRISIRHIQKRDKDSDEEDERTANSRFQEATESAAVCCSWSPFCDCNCCKPKKNATMEIRVKSIKQLFNTFDPRYGKFIPLFVHSFLFFFFKALSLTKIWIKMLRSLSSRLQRILVSIDRVFWQVNLITFLEEAGNQFVLVIHVGKKTDPSDYHNFPSKPKSIEKAIRNNFQRRASDCNRKMRIQLRDGKNFLILGSLILFICLFCKRHEISFD